MKTVFHLILMSQIPLSRLIMVQNNTNADMLYCIYSLVSLFCPIISDDRFPTITIQINLSIFFTMMFRYVHYIHLM